MNYIEFMDTIQERHFKYIVAEYDPEVFLVLRSWSNPEDESTWDVVRIDSYGNFTVNNRDVNMYDWLLGMH